jgi:uncharacterized membrane protein
MTSPADKRRWLDAFVLAAIAAAAALLRYWRIGYRPLSTDETLTTLISTGHSFQDVPIGHAWPLAHLPALFSPVYGQGAGDIARTLADPRMHHAHPPLFYVLEYAWISVSRPDAAGLAVAMRILPALFGVIVVALTFGLAREVAGRRAAFAAALIMAVSPLGVQLSQDARNYTLPLMFVVASLWALAAIVLRRSSGRATPAPLWLAWIDANALACYSHYFAVLSLTAQGLAMLWLLRDDSTGMSRADRRGLRTRIVAGLLAAIGLAAPLAQTLVRDYSRVSLGTSDNEWMRPESLAQPLAELASGWVSMLAPVPNEAMPRGLLLIAVVMIAMCAVAVAVAVSSSGRRQRRVQNAATRLLGLFAVIVLAELTVIVYGLQKDVFRYWRYHFVYFPAVVEQIAAGFTTRDSAERARRAWPARLGVVGLVIAGITGCVISAYGYGFQEPFQSRRIARDITSSGASTLTVMGGDSFLTTAMALGIAREIEMAAPGGFGSFGYMPWPRENSASWPGTLTGASNLPDELWLIHRPNGSVFPASVVVEADAATGSATCTAGSEGSRWTGLEYQRYRCAVSR